MDWQRIVRNHPLDLGRARGRGGMFPSPSLCASELRRYVLLQLNDQARRAHGERFLLGESILL